MFQRELMLKINESLCSKSTFTRYSKNDFGDELSNNHFISDNYFNLRQNTEKKLRVERLIRVKTEDVILESRFSTRIILKWPGFESLTFIKIFGISYLFLNETIKNFILSQFRHKSCFSSRSR